MLFILPTDTCFGIGCPINDINSYKKVYDLKGRNFDKLLAIMVENFENISEIAEISESNLEFIKNYPHPFSILLKPKKGILNNGIPNINDYEFISIRVANLECQKKLINQIGPIFLTSANLSGNSEIYSLSEAKKTFKDNDIIFIEDFDSIKKIPPSDIFKISENGELMFLRKNH